MSDDSTVPSRALSVRPCIDRVRVDDRHCIVEFVLEIPQGGEGPDGTVHDAARIELVLTDFGEPAMMIRPPDAGPAVPIEEYVEYVLRLAAGSEQ